MIRARTAAIAAGFVCGVLAGCANVEATRLYRSGTDALDRGEPQRAVTDLEHAAALAPEISAIQNHLGIAYEEAGRSDDALRAYERAVALDCDNRAAERNLRELQEARGSGSEVRGRQLDGPRSAPDGAEFDDLRSAPAGAERNTGQGAAR